MQGGGIDRYVLDAFQQNIIYFKDFDVNERSLLIIHADFGNILLCVCGTCA